MQKILTFLTFQGEAEAAINFYCRVFPGSGIDSLTRTENGKVRHARFHLADQLFMAIDSSVDHGFSFTPAMSIFVNCETDDEIGALFKELSTEGKVYMPLNTYPLSNKYAWV